MYPFNADGVLRLDKFQSTRASEANKRPLLLLEFTPSIRLKMPLPSGRWLVTTEVGGYDCVGGSSYWPDEYHTDSTGNYYSIDFTGPENTRILAPASGVVTTAGGTTDGANGYHIVIDHDGDGSVNTGFQTRYLHLKSLPAKKNGTLLKVGDKVNVGDQIGIMGNTGKYTTGRHLHFGVRYQNSGDSTVNNLAKAVMEGMLLKGYQTECTLKSDGTPIGSFKTYPSTNAPTGS